MKFWNDTRIWNTSKIETKMQLHKSHMQCKVPRIYLVYMHISIGLYIQIHYFNHSNVQAARSVHVHSYKCEIIFDVYTNLLKEKYGFFKTQIENVFLTKKLDLIFIIYTNKRIFQINNFGIFQIEYPVWDFSKMPCYFTMQSSWSF